VGSVALKKIGGAAPRVAEGRKERGIDLLAPLWNFTGNQIEK
jgi:hypothetical protein